jgi:hypothetical protein
MKMMEVGSIFLSAAALTVLCQFSALEALNLTSRSRRNYICSLLEQNTVRG